jgi:hypothetical protein
MPSPSAPLPAAATRTLLLPLLLVHFALAAATLPAEGVPRPPLGGPDDPRFATPDARARFAAEGQDDVAEAYRVTDPADIDFLQYLVSWSLLPNMSRVVLTEAQLEQPDLVVIEGDGGWQLTLKDLAQWMWARGYGGDVLRTAVNRPDVFVDGIAKGAYVRLAKDDALAAGFDADDGVATDMRYIREQTYMPMLYQQAFADSGQVITDEMVELEYERQKSTQYRTPMSFRIYHIFLRAYDEFEVPAGATDLLEIAREVTGSESGALQIRSIDHPATKRWVAEHDRDRLAYQPPRPGEGLYVPTDAGGWERLFGRANEVKARLLAGEDFETVAREVSDDPRPGESVWSEDVPNFDLMLPEVLNAIRTIPEHEWGGPIRSLHGLHFIQVTERQDERFTPLDEVRPEVRAAITNRAIQAAGDRLIGDLRQKPAVDERLLRRTASESLLPLDTVLAEYQGEQFTFDDLISSDDLRQRFAKAGADERIELVRRSVRLTDMVLSEFAEEKQFDKVPEARNRIDYYYEYSLAKRFEASQRIAGYRETTPLLYRFYREHAEYFRVPGRYDFVLLRVALPREEAGQDQAWEMMRKIVADRPDEARFRQMAAVLSDDPAVRERGGVYEGVLQTNLDEELVSIVPGLPVGAVSGPFPIKGTLNVILKTAEEKNVLPEFDEIFMHVAAIYREHVLQTLELGEVLRELKGLNAHVNEALFGEDDPGPVTWDATPPRGPMLTRR